MSEAARSQGLGVGPILLDAACGTRLILRGLRIDRDDPSLWILSHPDEILDFHRRDLIAGSDAVLTATFGANRAWLGRYDREAEVVEINRRGVELARSAGDGNHKVFGSVGPTALASVEDAREQAEILADAGCDAIVLETAGAESALRFLVEARNSLSLPIVASLFAPTVASSDSIGRLVDAGLDAIGANCQSDLPTATREVEFLRSVSTLPLWLKPGGGLPGGPSISPESFAEAAQGWLDLGVSMIGGCCGTTEAHVCELRRVIAARKPVHERPGLR